MRIHLDTYFWKLIACAAVVCLSACQEIDLRGLVVSYETVNQRFEQSMIWNEQNPYPDLISTEDSYELLAVSDLHVGDTLNLVHFLDIASQEQALAVFMAGDLTTGKSEHFQLLHDILTARDSLRFFTIPGNHDLYFGGWEHYRRYFGSSVYHFSIQTPNAADLYIFLDNAGASLGTMQLEWLQQLLHKERARHRYCILINHNNWVRIRRMLATNPYVEEIEVLLDLCLQYRVDMLISGHDHIKHTAIFGNTLLLTLDALRDAHPEPGYLQLKLSSDSIAYSFKDL